MTTVSHHPETIALHGGNYRKDETTNSVAVPIYQTQVINLIVRNRQVICSA